MVDDFSDDLGSKIMKNRLVKEERTKLFLKLGCNLDAVLPYIQGHSGVHFVV